MFWMVLYIGFFLWPNCAYVCMFILVRPVAMGDWAPQSLSFCIYLFVFIHFWQFFSTTCFLAVGYGDRLVYQIRDKFFFYSFFLFGNLFFKAYQPLEHQLQAVGCVVSNEAKTPQDISYRDLFLCSKTRKRKTIKYGICLLVIPVIVLHPRGIYQFK